jgi:hypothetical protein
VNAIVLHRVPNQYDLLGIHKNGYLDCKFGIFDTNAFNNAHFHLKTSREEAWVWLVEGDCAWDLEALKKAPRLKT